jgi:hypothetical protein
MELDIARGKVKLIVDKIKHIIKDTDIVLKETIRQPDSDVLSVELRLHESRYLTDVWVEMELEDLFYHVEYACEKLTYINLKNQLNQD